MNIRPSVPGGSQIHGSRQAITDNQTGRNGQTADRNRMSSVDSKLTADNVQRFCGINDPYYLHRFQQLARHETAGITFNWAAFLGGPYWALARGVWWLFWTGYTVEVIALGWLLANDSLTSARVIAAIVLVAGRIGTATTANPAYWQAFCLWRAGERSDHRFSLTRLLWVSAIVIPAAILGVAGVAHMPLPEFVVTFPNSHTLSTQTQIAINTAIEWTATQWAPVFDSATSSVRWILDLFENILLSIPWPALAAVVVLLAWRTGGLKLALLSFALLAYLGLFGYWEKSISTMSLVATSVVLCMVIGIPLGILCAKYPRVYRVAEPVMDMMQTMPSFVYLLPAIAFFSIGKPPAILATVVFALPPVIKLTALGIRQVPPNVKEAMLAFGANPLQLLIKAELPLALGSIMAGVNQSIMMSLSMVVIGALIGAGGLGYDVLSALQQMDNGAGILAGAAIVACAILLDRLIQGRKNPL